MEINEQGKEIIRLSRAYYNERDNEELRKIGKNLRKLVPIECLDTGGAHCLSPMGVVQVLIQMGLIPK